MVVEPAGVLIKIQNHCQLVAYSYGWNNLLKPEFLVRFGAQGNFCTVFQELSNGSTYFGVRGAQPNDLTAKTFGPLRNLMEMWVCASTGEKILSFSESSHSNLSDSPWHS